MRDIAIIDFLASLGYEGAAAEAARQALIAAGLTHAGKSRVAVNKMGIAKTPRASNLNG